MESSSALAVTAARALETTDTGRALWSEHDRAWASRAAAEVVGEGATADAFLARRATLVLERAGARDRSLPRAVEALRWRPWVGALVVGTAFLAGLAVDRIGGEQRINVLAPPVVALLFWNVAVYLILVARYVVRYGEPAAPGLFRRALIRLAGGAAKAGATPFRNAIAAFAADWSVRAAPLHGARAARIVHLAAAALAAGVIAGLYVRGLALDYRASWQSTFLTAPTVHTIVSIGYAPGARVTGIPVPSVDEIAAIRAPASESAARWLHLIAATLLLIVVLPRTGLALVAGSIERYRSRHVPIDVESPYFQRLLRGFRGGPAQIRVLPYSYTMPAACEAGVQAIVGRSFGGSAAVLVAAPVRYGAEDALPEAGDPGTTTIALFSAAATPETEVHGAFLAALRERCGALVALVDVSALAGRRSADPAAVETRLAAWRELANDARVPVVVVNLAAPDLDAAGAELDVALSPSTAAESAPRRLSP